MNWDKVAETLLADADCYSEHAVDIAKANDSSRTAECRNSLLMADLLTSLAKAIGVGAAKNGQ